MTSLCALCAVSPHISETVDLFCYFCICTFYDNTKKNGTFSVFLYFSKTSAAFSLILHQTYSYLTVEAVHYHCTFDGVFRIPY